MAMSAQEVSLMEKAHGTGQALGRRAVLRSSLAVAGAAALPPLAAAAPAQALSGSAERRLGRPGR
ncbi:hypothetical protein GCM10020000_09460 [Streptomyces olivoverticillatus]